MILTDTEITKLIEDNYNLVGYTLNHFYPDLKTDEDIIQIGSIGLCKAANNYDPTKGAFSTSPRIFIVA